MRRTLYGLESKSMETGERKAGPMSAQQTLLSTGWSGGNLGAQAPNFQEECKEIKEAPIPGFAVQHMNSM